MNIKRYGKWLAAVVTGSLLAVVLAGCGPRHHSPEARADWVMNKVTSDLALNESQSAKLETLKDEVLKAREAMNQRREDSRDSINVLLQQPTLDRNQVLRLVEGHTEVVNQQAPAVVAALGDFYDSLNPEQQAQLREKLQKFQGRMDKCPRHWH